MAETAGETAGDQEGGGARRIRDAALLLFGERGFGSTSLKAIAAEAGVSQALIVHHYGSKEGLRTVCDEHVVRTIRVHKQETISEAPQFDPLAGLRRMENGRPLLRYLVRTLAEGGPHASSMIDGMVSDAEAYMEQGERAGLIKPSTTPRDRAVLLVIWSLGALTLHEQVHRLLGADLLAHDVEVASLKRYLRPAVELYRQGLVEEGAFDGLAEFLAEPEAERRDPQRDLKVTGKDGESG